MYTADQSALCGKYGGIIIIPNFIIARQKWHIASLQAQCDPIRVQCDQLGDFYCFYARNILLAAYILSGTPKPKQGGSMDKAK